MMLVLPIAACGQGTDAPAPKQKITVRSDGQKPMHQLNDLNRAIALKRAHLRHRRGLPPGDQIGLCRQL